MLKKGKKWKLVESMSDVRKLEGGGLFIFKNSSVNGSMMDCGSSYVTTIND